MLPCQVACPQRVIHWPGQVISLTSSLLPPPLCLLCHRVDVTLLVVCQWLQQATVQAQLQRQICSQRDEAVIMACVTAWVSASVCVCSPHQNHTTHTSCVQVVAQIHHLDQHDVMLFQWPCKGQSLTSQPARVHHRQGQCHRGREGFNLACRSCPKRLCKHIQDEASHLAFTLVP